MNIYARIAILIFVILGVLFLASPVSAGGLVPCGGFNDDGSPQPACNACYFGVLINKVTRFGIQNLALPLAAFMFVFAGFLYFSSGGDEKRISAAKNTLKNVVFGLLIVLIAWFLVDTAIKALVGDQTEKNFFGVWGPWHNPFPDEGACDASISHDEATESEEVDPKDPQEEIPALARVVAIIFGTLIMAVSVIMILISALRFTTAREDEDTIRSARGMLLFALVGVAVAILAFVLPGLVQRLLQ